MHTKSSNYILTNFKENINSVRIYLFENIRSAVIDGLNKNNSVVSIKKGQWTQYICIF